MFWNKNRPKYGDFRIAEKFVATANGTVYEVQRYSSGWDCDMWITKQVCASMSEALKWVERYRKEAMVKYHPV